MSDAMMHPDTERLEAFADGTLPEADCAVVESHLLGCPRCQVEIEEWRTVFQALAGLPRFDPSPGFAERVMVSVTVAQPWTARMAAWVSRLLPRGTAAWALVTALTALPVLAAGGAATWLLSRPGLSPDLLWLYLQERAAALAGAAAAWAAEAFLQTSFVAWLLSMIEPLLAALGMREIGGLAALFAVLTVASSWVLYRNLAHEPIRERSYHVTYSF